MSGNHCVLTDDAVCCNSSQYSISTLSLMLSAGGYPQMYESVKAAQKVIKTYERNHDVIELRPLLLLHTTLNYFCCHTAEVNTDIISQETHTIFNHVISY